MENDSTELYESVLNIKEELLKCYPNLNPDDFVIRRFNPSTDIFYNDLKNGLTKSNLSDYNGIELFYKGIDLDVVDQLPRLNFSIEYIKNIYTKIIKVDLLLNPLYKAMNGK